MLDVSSFWLPLGPIAVHLELRGVTCPLPLALLRRASPPPFGVRRSLRVDQSNGAGADADLRHEAGRYLGPGFVLETGGAAPQAQVANAGALLGALAALLIETSRLEPILLMHAASLRWRGRSILVAGRSGLGKSTLASAHRGRALGANAAVVWKSGAGWWSAALPLTGHGDAAVRPGALPLLGALVLGAPTRRAKSAAEGAAWLLAVTAGARGLAPRLDLAAQLAAALPLRGRRLVARAPSLE